MNERNEENDVPVALWIFVAVALGIVLFFLSAVALNSLLRPFLFVILLGLIALVARQRHKILGYIKWIATHPNTSATINRVGDMFASFAAIAFRIFFKIVVVFCQAILWVATIPVIALSNAMLLLKREHRRSVADKDKLERWQESDTREVTHSHDSRSKFCLDNIGKEILIQYFESKRTIKPLRVFTKPHYRKTYVEAEENGEVKTFDIDDMTIGI